jgi:molybdate transport system ATP-binding protein
MTLSVALKKRLGGFTVDAGFTGAGGVTALFGRSGAGKSTVVNLIAGLLRPDAGSVVLDGWTLVDTARGIDLPPHRRRIGYVFQEGRLFPHLSVRANLAYGTRRTPAAERWASFDQIVALLGIEALLDRRPALLSGGEKQRVAIGRALLASPRLLLMDEPLASLDAQRKLEILPYIERLRDEMRLPVIYVSHALGEVARLADALVVMADGQVVASGPTGAVLSRLDLGEAIGRDEAGAVLAARVVAHDAATGVTHLAHPSGELFHPLLDAPLGATVRLRVRARDVALAVGEPGRLSIRNRLTATVAEIADRGAGGVDVRLMAGGEPLLARITRDAAAALDLAVGHQVTALIKTAAFTGGDDGGEAEASPGV